MLKCFYAGVFFGTASGTVGAIVLVVIMICVYRMYGLWSKPNIQLKEITTNHIDDVNMLR